jgi:cardiolipin synthase A/B
MSWLWLLVVAFVVVAAMNFSTGEKKIQRRIRKLYDVGDEQFVRSLGTLIGPPLRRGNDVRELINGNQIFPAMLEGIRGAQKTITFETFIYWSGSIGDQFCDALSERARAGVRVHVLLDWVGTKKMEKGLLDRLEEAGVEIQKYHPLRFYNIGRMNNRTHRKLLVIDGKLGFTGGVGIADSWLGDSEDPEHWRDSHFRIEGPVVAQMQAAFLDNWMKARGEVLHGDDYFPKLEDKGDVTAQMFKSSQGEGSESARLMFLLAMTSAKSNIRISASYFVPDDLSISTLVAAVERGVHAEVILPGSHIDTKVTRKASRARWKKLLECGVEIHEFQPTMYHTKTMIIDDCLVSVGSTNFDTRSFRLNDEANLNVMDTTFATRMIEVFERDKQRSKRITYEEWLRRPVLERIVDKAAELLRSQL